MVHRKPDKYAGFLPDSARALAGDRAQPCPFSTTAPPHATHPQQECWTAPPGPICWSHKGDYWLSAWRPASLLGNGKDWARSPGFFLSSPSQPHSHCYTHTHTHTHTHAFCQMLGEAQSQAAARRFLKPTLLSFGIGQWAVLRRTVLRLCFRRHSLSWRQQ